MRRKVLTEVEVEKGGGGGGALSFSSAKSGELPDRGVWFNFVTLC